MTSAAHTDAPQWLVDQFSIQMADSAAADAPPADAQRFSIPPEADVLKLSLPEGVQTIDLHFPTFTDGRAFSQAVVLRRRLGFGGEIRANGDVLIDQLLQLKRCGFSTAVLRADQDGAHGARLLGQFSGFYQ